MKQAVVRRSWWLGVWFAAGLSLASCGDAAVDPAVDETGDLVENVTDVSHTDVRNQSIGNCWSYASTGWLESLHRARTGQDVNVSESWITFWDWHRKITGYGGVTRNATTMRDEVSTGGWWDTAVTILRDRGVVFEAEFIPEEATSARSTRQSEALAAINNELNGEGRLATTTARRDPQVVLNVLLDAWRINDDVRAEIRRVYGLSARNTLATTRERPAAWMRKASAFPIRTMVGRTTGDPVRYDGNLSDVIPGGRYAWRSVSYPTTATARTEFQRRVIRSLNAAQPVMVSWLVDFNARSSATGTFDLATLRAASGPGRQGGHLVTSEDYEVIVRQPGTPERRLAAGQMASAADMRLAERYGEMVFLRIKNSWGTAQGPLGGTFGGYHDLMVSYLNGPIRWTEASADRTPWSSAILPSGF